MVLLDSNANSNLWGHYFVNNTYDGIQGGYCPCDNSSATSNLLSDPLETVFGRRFLAEEEDIPVWEPVIVSITLATMFGIMIMDYIFPDWVMVAGLTVFMVTEIITIKEGLEGFANEGILTVMALFIVAEGVSRTGALDYYLGMILGKPKTVAGAQMRLMIPIAAVSAFFNNTPIVAVMIPLTIRWGKNIGVPRQQLLIPLSYATILGGTCTLVGTSTNLVVSGLLKDDYPNDPAGNLGLFGVGKYGVPNAIIGISYMLLFAPFLLPHGGGTTSTETEDLLLGARVTPWSPAAGRTVRRSGLIESGGVYLVNVKRATTGNVHHSVSEDFVLSVGDVIYFTGDISEFSRFCEKHCLEIVTNDKDDTDLQAQRVSDEKAEIGTTRESIIQSDEADRLRVINQLSDIIQNREAGDASSAAGGLSVSDAVRIVVTADAFHTEGALMIGVDCFDRPGLLMDISQVIFEQNYQIRHSEAKVVDDRSLSVWRCQQMQDAHPSPPNLGEIWEALSTLIHLSDPATVSKKSGAHVVRATVIKGSRLVGKLADSSNFRATYKAGIVAYQKDNKNTSTNVPFGVGDVLILDVAENSPLLLKPPPNFYDIAVKGSRRSVVEGKFTTVGGSEEDVENDAGTTAIWKDLRVAFDEDDDGGHSNLATVTNGEFLTAFTIPPGSPVIDKSLSAFGYSRLPGVVLVSIERPIDDPKIVELDKKSDYGSEHVSTDGRLNRPVKTLSSDDALQIGDIIWYTGSAAAIADLQKVNGLVFYQEDEIKKAVPVLQDRRLVQAVIARGSPLIGKTVNESRFRSKYGGVVLAVQRGSSRVHDHPGNVVIQIGDVLLIDASPEFIDRFEDNYKTFALVTEVENSSPPRPRLFLLCVALIAASLAIAALEISELLITSAIVGIVMVACGVVTQQEARDALHWDLYVTVGAAFGVANAMENSGVSEGVATGLVKLGQSLGIGDAGVYGAVYLAGNLLSAILTNNAAAAITYPIAMAAVEKTNTDRVKMAYILMLSASDYMTSFGYQTNLMVYGPGGYTNMDFLRFGAPMTLILWFTSTALISLSNRNWYVSWLICAFGFFIVAAFRLTNGMIFRKKG